MEDHERIILSHLMRKPPRELSTEQATVIAALLAQWYNEVAVALQERST